MKRRKGFTLIELLVVIAIIALLISILLPSLSRARELSKRLVCAANIKGIGTSLKIYANDFAESWPVPAFDETQDPTYPVVDYIAAAYQPSTPNVGSVPVPGRLRRSVSGTGGTNTITTTRAFWMLVRSGDVTPKQFTCPSSGDQIENEANIDIYYDFAGRSNISYGYQVPYGPFDSRASENSDPRQAVASDKGPYASGAPAQVPSNVSGADLSYPDFKLTPQQWQTWNSGNHGGSGTGEGQNVLYADGHATFEKTPLAGIDNDNIFTRMGGTISGDYKWLGEGIRPGQNAASGKDYPGYLGLGGSTTAPNDSTTDSLIYP